MNSIQPVLLPRRPQELYRIKIGGLSTETYTAKSGKTFRRPVKYEHFEIVGRERRPDGNLRRADEIHRIVGDKPTELDVRLMFPEVGQNLQTEMTEYVGKTRVRSCDGTIMKDIQAGTTHPCGRKQEGGCGCKPYARLAVQLEVANLGGFAIFRTTSWESTANLQSTLEMLYDQFGTLRNLPCRLVVYPATDTHDGKTSTSYKVGIVLRGSILEAQQAVAELASAGVEVGPGAVRLPSPVAVLEELDILDTEERGEIAAEFFPDPDTELVEAETHARRTELIERIGDQDDESRLREQFQRMVLLARPGITGSQFAALSLALTGKVDYKDWTVDDLRTAIKKFPSHDKQAKIPPYRRGKHK